MSVDDDAGVLFFLRRKLSIVVGVQKLQDRLMSLRGPMVLKHFYMGCGRKILAKASSELHFVVDHIIVADVATDEADDDRLGHRSSALGLRRYTEICQTKSADQKEQKPRDPEGREHLAHHNLGSFLGSDDTSEVMVTPGLNRNKKGLAVLVLRYREFLNRNRIYGLAPGEVRGVRVAAGGAVLARNAAFIERAA